MNRWDFLCSRLPRSTPQPRHDRVKAGFACPTDFYVSSRKAAAMSDVIARNVAPERRRNAFVLAVIVVSQLMIVLDGTVVYTALPQIQTGLGLTLAELSWVQNAYAITFGGMMLLGARAGDIVGRRRVFIAAIAFFTVASWLGGLADSGVALIAWRAMQGIAAAFAAPSALALLMTCFPGGAARSNAIKLYTAVSGAGSASGLVIGGALTDAASWRWVLFVNVPIGVALIVLAPLCLRESTPQRKPFDMPGAVTVTTGMGTLVYAFIHATSHGWKDRLTVPLFFASVLLLVAFYMIEKRAQAPIVPLRLLSSVERLSAYICRALLIGGMLGTFFFLTQYVQHVLGFTALKAGMSFLPLSLTQFVMVMVVSPRLAVRMGNAGLVCAGLLATLAGMVCLSLGTPGAAYFPYIALPLVLLGIGTGAALVPLTMSGIAGVAPEDAGAASGIVNVSQQVGGSLGTAIFIAIAAMTSVYSPDSSTSRDGYSHGLSVAATGSIVFFTVALAITFMTARIRRRAG